MDGNIYRSLGTSNKRREKRSDHKKLRALFSKEWNFIRDFCHNPPDKIRNWQFNRIKQLVKYAFEKIPLYKEKYSKIGFIPSDLKTWEDFRSLPMLTKDELINSFPDKTVSRDFDFEFTTRSSGSSGRFVTIVVSPEAIYKDTIQGIRQFYFQSGRNYNPNDLALFIYTSPWWVASVDGDYRTAFLPTTTKIDKSVQTIERLKPKILSLYPSYLLRLYEEKAPLKKYGVKLIVVHSEQSSFNERQELSKFFGVPVLDEFSSEELTRIALECPYRNYHLEEDACYIEIVNPKSKHNLGSGKTGLVVGTNLLNKATPIIRYSQGDLASISKSTKCKCRSNFRISTTMAGRYMDSVVSTSGDLIPSGCFMDLAYNWYLELDVPVHGLRYQIIQNKNGNVHVYLVSGPYGISPSQRQRVKMSMYQLLPKDMKVFVHVVDKPPINKGTKYRPVISLKGK